MSKSPQHPADSFRGFKKDELRLETVEDALEFIRGKTNAKADENSGSKLSMRRKAPT